MKDIVETLPGIEQIRARFLDLLAERQSMIAHHTLAAWETRQPAKARGHLGEAQSILHQIAGSAGSLGFNQLGETARDCENEIITHLAYPDVGSLSIPAEIMFQIDTFVSMSQDILSNGV